MSPIRAKPKDGVRARRCLRPVEAPKDAIAAYKRAADLDPEDARGMGALAQALLNNNQLDEALKVYRQMAAADPEDAGTSVHISEILRRQGKYEEALTTVKKAVKKDPDSLEAGYNEGLLLDVLGRYDEVRAGLRAHGRPDLACQRRLYLGRKEQSRHLS